MAGTLAETQSDADISVEAILDRPWVCLVWDDPVNLMTYVEYVFIKIFQFSKERAHSLMMKVHIEGKAVVASGSREEMEHYVQALHDHGLWATLQRDDKI